MIINGQLRYVSFAEERGWRRRIIKAGWSGSWGRISSRFRGTRAYQWLEKHGVEVASTGSRGKFLEARSNCGRTVLPAKCFANLPRRLPWLPSPSYLSGFPRVDGNLSAAFN